MPSVNFSSGNSGNLLYEAVVKVGPGCQQEGAFCQHLGPVVAPVVHYMIPNGYVMERLKPAVIRRRTLIDIETALADYIWCRPALPSTNDTSWREVLAERYAIDVPDWVGRSEPCLVHGDPTLSNALYRENYTSLIMGDPRPPRDYMPQTRETDMGRILQSYMGWEVAAYGYNEMAYSAPFFVTDATLYREALFWCGAAASRIQYLELSRGHRKNILDWCQRTREFCHV